MPTVLAEELEFKDKTIDDLKAVQIKSAKGGLHRLDEVSAINKARGRARIMRVNQDKQLDLYYSFGRNAEESKQLLESYRSDIDALVAGYNLPSGLAIEVIHEEDEFAEFKFLILAALILIFMILASVFESFTTPFVLLFSIPLAAIGSLLALILTGNSLLNANTLMGFLILLGVVVNNGIILIDYTNILRNRGYRRNRALMMAGLSRIRPILITSITTIVAMLPLAMGDAEYSGAIGAPFAITVIGGLAFSTILTLVYIPTVCLGLENALTWYRGLSPKLWITHAILFVIGVAAIYLYADGLLWQSICLIAIVILIPGITFFIQASLRRASEGIIDPDEEIQITVRNLVKVYERPGKIRRDLTSGDAVRKRLGESKDYHSLRDFLNDIWLIVVLVYTIYLAWFHIEKKLWIFLLSFAIYAMVLLLWRKLRKYLFYRFDGSRVIKIVNRIIFWSIPPVVWFMMSSRMDNTGFSFFVGVLWAAGIAIYVTSRRLYEKDINIERVTGRFAGLRRSYYRFVKSIPVIGKQKKPFKALRGVSFTIHKGMFGLLGPNGAGKSTMMRIICGILEQSYGSIYVNNLDAREYREELQGLIGFLPQEFGTYEHMTSMEFLDYQAILKGLTDKKLREERIEYVLKAVHMYERKDDKIGSFSGGMKQRIGIALILLHLPRILIVDEPTAGLDPRERIRFRNLLVELSKERIVIFSTHIIEDISSSCSQVVVINKGELKYFGDPVDMVNMATGKVWQFHIDKSAFETLDKSMVIHHMQNGDIIQVRYLSYEKPHPDAVLVEVNLEDAYLCLLKNMN
ncbi:ATP-binding cassette domain-containing protein [Bacteroides sp. 519]|nr:ATP-binding cassette domain-containing protein [Bacteroides sp. 519]